MYKNIQQATALDITELIPHRPPMLLIDKVLYVYEHGVVAVVIPSLHPNFVREAALPSWISLECLAQGSGISLYTLRQNGNLPERGMIVGCRDLILSTPIIRIDQELIVKVDFDSPLKSKQPAVGLIRFAGSVHTVPIGTLSRTLEMINSGREPATVLQYIEPEFENLTAKGNLSMYFTSETA